MNASKIIHRVLAVGDQTGIGVTQVRTAALQAYAKPAVGYIGANEIVCGEIARLLRLPVPVFGLAHSGVYGQPTLFCSVSFNFSEQDLPPVDPAAFVAASPQIAGGVVVFDALVANTDRHPRNLAMSQSAGQPPAILVYDHSHALLGPKGGDGIKRLTALRDRLALNLDGQSGGNRHCLADHIPDAALLLEPLDRVKSLPKWWIRDVVNGAIGISATEADAAVEFLSYRVDNLRAIFQKNVHQFSKMENQHLL